MEEPRAVSDRLFIRLEKQESPLILSASYHRTNIGTVISVGPLVRAAKKGDKVLFHPFDDLPSYDPDVVVIRENSLLGLFQSK